MAFLALTGASRERAKRQRTAAVAILAVGLALSMFATHAAALTARPDVPSHSDVVLAQAHMQQQMMRQQQMMQQQQMMRQQQMQQQRMMQQQQMRQQQMRQQQMRQQQMRQQQIRQQQIRQQQMRQQQMRQQQVRQQQRLQQQRTQQRTQQQQRTARQQKDQLQKQTQQQSLLKQRQREHMRRLLSQRRLRETQKKQEANRQRQSDQLATMAVTRRAILGAAASAKPTGNPQNARLRSSPSSGDGRGSGGGGVGKGGSNAGGQGGGSNGGSNDAFKQNARDITKRSIVNVREPKPSPNLVLRMKNKLGTEVDVKVLRQDMARFSEKMRSYQHTLGKRHAAVPTRRVGVGIGGPSLGGNQNTSRPQVTGQRPAQNPNESNLSRDIRSSRDANFNQTPHSGRSVISEQFNKVAPNVLQP